MSAPDQLWATARALGHARDKAGLKVLSAALAYKPGAVWESCALGSSEAAEDPSLRKWVALSPEYVPRGVTGNWCDSLPAGVPAAIGGGPCDLVGFMECAFAMGASAPGAPGATLGAAHFCWRVSIPDRWRDFYRCELAAFDRLDESADIWSAFVEAGRAGVPEAIEPGLEAIKEQPTWKWNSMWERGLALRHTHASGLSLALASKDIVSASVWHAVAHIAQFAMSPCCEEFALTAAYHLGTIVRATPTSPKLVAHALAVLLGEGGPAAADTTTAGLKMILGRAPVDVGQSKAAVALVREIMHAKAVARKAGKSPQKAASLARQAARQGLATAPPAEGTTGGAK